MITETATSDRRRLRILAGEGMVTPSRPLELITEDGAREKLIPGRHRFAPDHRVVKLRPEAFRLCDPRDRTSAPSVFRHVLQRARRDLGKQERATMRRGYHLPDRHEPRGEEAWRL